MREDPVISGAWIKAALVVLVGGALGVGAYLLASDTDLNLPDIDLDTTAETTLSDTTLETTTIGRQEPPPAPEPRPERPAQPQPAPTPSSPSIQDVQELGRCTQAAQGDIEAIQRCFERFAQR
jgi:hypothetical protein